MASKHILSLEIPTVSNCDLLCIKDTSQYSSELAVDCEELLITLPGFSVPVLIDVDKSFEGKMLVFPSKLQHLVYPFYTSDEHRITVSGNVNFWVD